MILPYFKQKYSFDNQKNEYGLMDYGASWALVGKHASRRYCRGVRLCRSHTGEERTSADQGVHESAGRILSAGFGDPRIRKQRLSAAVASRSDCGEESPLEQMVSPVSCAGEE